MREIDFLPEWYKSGRRRQIGYRTQYVALGGIFVVMMVWNFIATRSISKATAELAQMAPRVSVAESASREFAGIKNQMTELQKKANIMGEIDSKIDVAEVLAEMSFLIDEQIVLGKVEFGAERFVGEQGRKPSPRAGTAVRVAGDNSVGEEVLSLGDVRFKVVISGVASNASDVAELVCKLEDSPYFCLLYPSFSRNREMKVGPIRSKSRSGTTAALVRTSNVPGTNLAEGNFQVTEFEIGCYLANYREEVKRKK